MAGDWIKFRSCLIRHPKVVRISSALKADKFRTIGGLMSVWCLFDEQTEDGFLDSYTMDFLDSEIGFPGLASAMKSVGWLEESAEGLLLPEFEKHNGQSAKRRAQDADRKREVRKMSASEADKKRTREEKRREEIKDSGSKTDVGEPEAPREVAKARPSDLSAAMRRNSIEAQPGDPRIVAAAEAGISVETIEAACAEAKASDPVGRIKPGFVIAIAERWTREAAAPRARASPQRSYHDERADVIAQLTGRKAAHQPSDAGVIDVNDSIPRLGS